MAAEKDLLELKANIEHWKKIVREDLAHLNERFHEALGPLSLTHFVKEHVLVLCGASLAVGWMFGYQGVPVADLAKPAVRTTLTTAGKQAAIRWIRGKRT